MYFLHHLGSQDRGEFVCNPRRQLSSWTGHLSLLLSLSLTWVGVSHVAKVAALTSQRSDQESCQVGHAPHKTSLRRVLSVKDTVVDDVILKQIESLIDISLIGSRYQSPAPPVVFVSKISGGQSPCSSEEADSGGRSRRRHCWGWEIQVLSSRSCACPSSEVTDLEDQIEKRDNIYLSIDRVMEDVVQSICRYISEGCLQSDHSEMTSL